jgi:hypothetical protein
MKFQEKYGGGSVELSELSLHNLIEAFKNYAHISGIALAYGCAKLCIIKYNGQDAQQGNPEFEKWWNDLGSKNRQLVLEAYMRLSIPSDEEKASVENSIIEVEKDGKIYSQAIISGNTVLFGNVTMEQLIGISRRSKDNPQLTNLYSALNAIAFINDNPIADKEGFFKGLTAKERQLYIEAYNKISSISDEDVESFFDSSTQPSGT